MSNFEVLTLLVSCLAVGLSLHTLREQRKLQREANELQRVTADLAKRQIDQLEQQEAEKQRARLAVDMYKDGNNYRLRISNVGACDALNANIQLVLPHGLDSPLVKQEYEEKFPLKRLNPGSWVTLFCAVYMDSPSSFDGVLSWDSPDGTHSNDEFTVFVP